jgi:hypothetical protein
VVFALVAAAIAGRGGALMSPGLAKGEDPARTEGKQQHDFFLAYSLKLILRFIL